jgi:uncharacterized membrane protein
MTELQHADHVTQTVDAIAKLHSEHHSKRTLAERMIDRWTTRLSRPWCLFAISLGVAAWIVLNTTVAGVDPPPFAWLSNALTFCGVVVALLILSTQRRAAELAEIREQLTLKMATVTERKVTKVIELLEELRRDSPDVRNRVDHEAKQMSARAQASDVLGAITEPPPQASDKSTPKADPPGK